MDERLSGKMQKNGIQTCVCHFFVPFETAQIVPPAVTQIVSTPLIQNGYNVIVSPAVTQIDPLSIRLALDVPCVLRLPLSPPQKGERLSDFKQEAELIAPLLVALIQNMVGI